jgi:hypothetical protein
MKIKIKLNVKNLFQKIWIISHDKQNMNNPLQNNIQHLEINKYYIKENRKNIFK